MERSTKTVAATPASDQPEISFLIYVSIATKLFTESELINLLEVSRKNNAAAGVTGMLLYKDKKFMQLLEGEEKEVARIFGKILKDPRHHNVITLWKGQRDERDFSEWLMGFTNLDAASVESIPGYSEYLNTPLTADAFPDPSNAQRLLRIFKRTGLSL
jgi:Sensors of blue-light using FAD